MLSLLHLYLSEAFPRPGSETGLPQILVQLAGSRPYSGPGRDKAMTRSRKSYIVNNGKVAKTGQRKTSKFIVSLTEN